MLALWYGNNRNRFYITLLPKMDKIGYIADLDTDYTVMKETGQLMQVPS